jgi:pSer/pThr/pTyr-binding forkhead associated (FHA) protein
MASLLIVSGPCEGQFHRLGQRATVVGRDEGCTLQVADALVSRRHLEIDYDATAPGYVLRDLGSANGTRLNDSPLEQPATLADGDLICIGKSELLFWKQDVGDPEQALARYRQRGERGKSTMITSREG